MKEIHQMSILKMGKKFDSDGNEVDHASGESEAGCGMGMPDYNDDYEPDTNICPSCEGKGCDDCDGTGEIFI
jgi:hypothetical protein